MSYSESNTTGPNHALQRTGSAVTAPAADHRRLSSHRQVPRRLRLSLSLGSLGDATRTVKTKLSAFAFAMFSVCSYAQDLLPVLPGRLFQAVILPADIAKTSKVLANRFTDFWTPTVEQVALAENRISDFLAAAPTNESLRPTQRKLSLLVRDEPTQFIRQYVGGIRDGRRVIYCVGNRMTPAETKKRDAWRRRLIFWFDAGTTWQIDYDLKDDVCRRFYFDEGY